MFKSDPTPRPAGSSFERRDSIDFWRGLVLCTIFINHIPGNVFEYLTQKNVGFSDSAEAFVFLSGLSLALAYGHRFLNGGAGMVVHSLARRAVKLYGVHLLLSCAAVAIFAAGATLGNDESLLDVHGRDLFLDDPWAALVGLLSLGHQLGYFNILPLYVLMIAAVPIQLWIARAGAGPMLAASFALYLASRALGWNIPTWPMKGTWFFDPFAWQFLMAIGLATGVSLKKTEIPRLAPLFALSTLVVLYAAFSVTNMFSFCPGLQDWTRSWADLDKTMLGSGRIIHFMAIAYLLYGLRAVEWLGRLPLYKPLCLLGRNSLWMFGLLSLMAALGQVLTQLFGHTIALDVAMIGGGLVTLYGTARLLEIRRTAPVPSVTASERLMRP
jgi:hypothetical protein